MGIKLWTDQYHGVQPNTHKNTYDNLELNHMTGELNREQIDNLLRSQVMGRLGCCKDDQVYIVPLTYAYDGEYIYLHTIEGLKIDMMRSNHQVCFQVDCVENMANWQSVILWGEYQELMGNEAQQALLFITNRVVPFITSETIRPHYGLQGRTRGNANVKMVVFRIKVARATGRYEKSQ